MSHEKTVLQLENENRELKQLLSDTLKAASILQGVARRYGEMVNTEDTKISESEENVKKLLEKYSSL